MSDLTELTQRVEQIAQAMQDSYQADLDLMTRRDEAQTAEIAALRQRIKELELDSIYLREVAEPAIGLFQQRIRELEAQVREPTAERWERMEHVTDGERGIIADDIAVTIGRGDVAMAMFSWPENGYEYALMRRKVTGA